MTATPIPRTVAMTIFGDLDVSTLRQLPSGRIPIETHVIPVLEKPHYLERAWVRVKEEVAKGHQAYIVAPRISDGGEDLVKAKISAADIAMAKMMGDEITSEELAGTEKMTSVEELAPKLATGALKGLKLAPLHGRQSSELKDETMSAFAGGEIDVLVATTVIEVGVDVPNATVMLIEHAERFGLSQLHQLRGRVGRGAAQSYCLLMSSSRSPDAQQRLKVLEQSQDGFFISEMDMRFRGPGEVMGTRQSGVADFTLASLVEDEDILLLARQAAEKVIEMDASLARWPLMQDELKYRYERLMGGAILT
jgi:ATP-dependent DNA helicase RecG